MVWLVLCRDASSYCELGNILRVLQLMGFLQAEQISCSSSEKWKTDRGETQKEERAKRRGDSSLSDDER